ncbi:acyltransferase family protein [Microbacterium hatanonis]|uniref:Acyltransferase n=1 Tax=Microbacterium hatanonis TaxID=404366 RepID=A0A5C8HZ37_9MICO|nr:acyltransferase [Microbacterium hatanonis]TXK10324.1 acyltransferase [Microbacterium hatanonis]
MRIYGLDAIRIICAAIVALGHFPFDFTESLTPALGSTAANFVDALLGNAFNGPAAVIVFFVLSGFVIHLPYTSGRKFFWGEFAARRYTRIIPPLVIFMILSFAFGRPVTDWDWNNTVLWSVICELIYYTMYPALRRLRVSFLNQTFVAFGVAAALGIAGWPVVESSGEDYVVFGYFTFLLGLPAWLAGCALAERRERFRVLTPAAMWAMRVAIFALSVIFRAIKFHGEPYVGVGASNVYLLTVLALPTTIWLGFEAKYYAERTNRSVRLLDRGGAASYSLYLVHTLALTALANVLVLGDIGSFVIYGLATTLGTIVFYWMVERPSHLLARRFGSAARSRREMGEQEARLRSPS